MHTQRNNLLHSIPKLLVTLTLFISCQSVAIDLGTRDAYMWRFEEFSLANSSYTGNPFDVRAEVTMHHNESDETRTTEMFYAGSNTWRFRLTPSQLGTYIFTTSSLDPELDGHRGQLQVTSNPNPNERGFLTHRGHRWVWEGNNEAIVPQYMMWGGNGNDASRLPEFADDNLVEAMIQEFIVEHGFTGFHTGVMARGWFNFNRSAQALVASENNPNLSSFAALENLITRTYRAGGHIHIWKWGDQARGLTPEQVSTDQGGGLNGVIDLRLQRYIAARLGPLPGWSMGYGFDVDEWDADASQGEAWRNNMQSKSAWFHFFGSRPAGPNSGTQHQVWNDWNARFDYSSYEHHLGALSNEEVYLAFSDALQQLNQPAFSEDRTRLGYSRSKDVNPQQTRDMMWASAMAGGIASIWGDREPGSELPSKAFSNKAELQTYAAFFRDQKRFLVDMEQANALSSDSNTRVLFSPGTDSYVLYREDADQINIDLSGSRNALRAVAVNTLLAYEEIDLGYLPNSVQTINLPSRSHWAVAIGDFDQHRETSPPLAEFTIQPKTIEYEALQNTVVTLDASTSYDPDGGPITQYNWSLAGAYFVNGTQATDKIAMVTLNDLGVEQSEVVLTVTDDEGSVASATDYVEIIFPDTEPPETPQNVRTEFISTQQVDLVWDASTDNQAVTQYSIYRNGVLVAETANTLFSDREVSAQTAYSYELEAVDAAGNRSQLSAPLVVQTPGPEGVFKYYIINEFNRAVYKINNGDEIPLDSLPPVFNIEARTTQTFASVTFSVSGSVQLERIEERAIWTVFDSTVDVSTIDGDMLIRAKGFSEDGASGIASEESTIAMRFIRSNSDDGNDDGSDDPPPPDEETKTHPLDPAPGVIIEKPVGLHIDFSAVEFGVMQNDVEGEPIVEEGGRALKLMGNQWPYVPINYQVTSNTMLAFDMSIRVAAEIQGIGFDTNSNVTSLNDHSFNLTDGNTRQAFGQSDFLYSGTGEKQSFTIPVGQYFTGPFSKLVLMSDDDNEYGADSTIGDIVIYEQGAPAERYYLVPENATWNSVALDLYGTENVASALLDVLGVDFELIPGARILVSDLPEALQENETDEYPLNPLPDSLLSDLEELNINFSNVTLGKMNNGIDGEPIVSEAGASLNLFGNQWPYVPISYRVTSKTMLEFDFSISEKGEIQGIGFDTDDSVTSLDKNSFNLTTGETRQDFGLSDFLYSGNGEDQNFVIPVGQYFTGNFNRLVLISDDDRQYGANSKISHIRVYESDAADQRYYLVSEDTTWEKLAFTLYRTTAVANKLQELLSSKYSLQVGEKIFIFDMPASLEK